uniref:ASCH domain-containing protein n=1 Tax=Hot spring virus BHS1 TaxID=2024351 RepID=A0A2U7NYH3_9VIRU|nr:hypothetical protein [Hot spring virus BHS1]
MTYHLAFVKPKTVQYILDGSQICESRLSKVRHAAMAVKAGDYLIFKAGDGRALATVDRVDIYESLRPLDIDALESLYSPFVDGPKPDPDYWRAKRESRYAVFMWLTNVIEIHIPKNLLPSTQSAWIGNYQPTEQVLRCLNLRADGSDSNRQPSLWRSAAPPIAPHPR